MEQALDKKEAKKLAREKQLIRLKKDSLIREKKLDKINIEKVREKWYNNLLNNKIPEMQDNLRYILYYMEKLIEDDSFIKFLFESERDKLVEKSTLQAQSHSSALDTLYGIYMKRIQDLHNAYTQGVSQKIQLATAEFNSLENRESTTQENMQTMLYQIQFNREKKEDTMNCDMFLKLDDERSKNTERYDNLRSKLEKKMEKRWGEITATMSDYEKNTQQRRKDYDQLKAKDNADSKIICQQVRKTQKLFEQLGELKNCFDECYAPEEMLLLITDLRDEKEKFLNAFNTLKAMLVEELKLDEVLLKNLTVSSNRTINDLKRICAKGEQILTLFRICRKMETEQEKVTLVGRGIDTSERKMKEEIVTSYHDDGSWTKDYEILDQFWMKAGNVQLSKVALKKCIQNLEKQNSILRKSLISYLSDAGKKFKK